MSWVASFDILTPSMVVKGFINLDWVDFDPGEVVTDVSAECG